MVKVRHFTDYEFFTVKTAHEEKRYFNGREWHVLHELTHFIHPNNHRSDFSTHVTATFYQTGRWQSEMLRHSQFQWGPGNTRIIPL